MITQKDVGAFIEGLLNTQLGTYKLSNSVHVAFRLITDVGEYVDFEYLDGTGSVTEEKTGTIVKYINTFFAATGSTVEGVDEYEYTYSTSLSFMVPILGGLKKAQYNQFLTDIQTIINEVFKENKLGTTTVGTGVNAVTYTFGMMNTLCTTGTRDQRPYVGDSVELDAYSDFYFVQSGLNSTDIEVKLDGNIIYSERIGFNRETASKTMQNSQSGSLVTKSVPTSTVLAISFDMPARLNDVDKALRDYLFRSDMTIHYVEVKIKTAANTYETEGYYMRFDSSSMAKETAKFAAASAKLVEAEVLDPNTELSTYAQTKWNEV